MTAYRDLDHVERAEAAGFDLYFTKPADSGELAEQLRAYLLEFRPPRPGKVAERPDHFPLGPNTANGSTITPPSGSSSSSSVGSTREQVRELDKGSKQETAAGLSPRNIWYR